MDKERDMGAAAFTPGPWAVARDGGGYPAQIIAPEGDDGRPGKVGRRITRWQSIMLPSNAEGEANARLIAASPALYSALERMERAFQMLLAGQPVRDADEVLAEAAAALELGTHNPARGSPMNKELFELAERLEATIYQINGHWWNRRKRPDARDVRAAISALRSQATKGQGE